MSADGLVNALVAALGELSDPKKQGKADTGKFAYSYLTLPDLLNAIRPVFAKHGLAVSQTVERTEIGVAVTTAILHASGDERATPPFELRCGPGAQDVGSAVTYARRYSLAALCGLAGDVDDDGERAQKSAPPARPSAVDPDVKDRVTTATTKRELVAILGDKDLASDLWNVMYPPETAFTAALASRMLAAARALVAGTAHLEVDLDGAPRLVEATE